MGLRDKLRHAWNAFTNQDSEPRSISYGSGISYGPRPPDRTRLRTSNERSIIASIYTRLSIDAAAIELRHVKVDEDVRYLETVDSGLNNCLKLEANMDQAARQFRQDIFLSLFDEGAIAIVPVDTSVDPMVSGGFDVKTLRVGKIVEWKEDRVKARVYRESTGQREDIVVPKKFTAIVENPFFSVMNEPNSTLRRLIHKLNLLDAVDEQSSSGKLDIIIQLPYVIRSEARREAAKQRRNEMEHQLANSRYGVAYADGTEKITQLNRPAENNLLKQVEFLTEMLYAELGLTKEVMNGTADEKTMLNYFARTIEPLVTAVVEAMRRAFLTKTARTQGQWIMYFRDPLKLVPMSDLAEIADKLTRSLVATSNDLRQAVGWKPSKDPKADQLINSNMPDQNPAPSEPSSKNPTKEEGDSQNGSSRL